MKTSFRYDYKHKVTGIVLLASLLFVLLSFFTRTDVAVSVVSLIFSFFLFLTAIFLIRTQGLHLNINKKKLYIFDYLLYRSFNLDDINYVSIHKIDKKKGSRLRGFLWGELGITDPRTYMDECDFVYNNGIVFSIKIHFKNGHTTDSYFGWMYKEKSLKRIAKKTQELDCFCRKINSMCKNKVGKD